MIVAKDKGGGDRQLPTAGVCNAVCSKAFDLGMQSNNYNGEMSYQHKCLLVFELEETIADEASEYFGKRLLYHLEVTLSLNEKAKLRGYLESWRGKEFTPKELQEGFDLEKLLSVQCTLNIIHKTAKSSGRPYAAVSSILPALKDAPMMNPELAKDWCPDWIKTKIAAGDGAEGDVSESKDFDDDVPF